MNYHWISKQGKERIYNNDSALIVDDEYYSLAVLMDAAQKNDQDTAFIRYFMSKIKDEVLTYQTSRCPDTNDLIQSLIHIQKGMRSQFLFNIASYLILLLPKQESDLSAKIIHCGDCRLGIRRENGDIMWQTNVHTAANSDGSFFSEECYLDPARHMLTRCLNARRFQYPDVQEIHSTNRCTCRCTWLLCTDGYWAEYLQDKNNWKTLQDDASCLEISAQITESSQESDTDNFTFLSR